MFAIVYLFSEKQNKQVYMVSIPVPELRLSN